MDNKLDKMTVMERLKTEALDKAKKRMSTTSGYSSKTNKEQSKSLSTTMSRIDETETP